MGLDNSTFTPTSIQPRPANSTARWHCSPNSVIAAVRRPHCPASALPTTTTRKKTTKHSTFTGWRWDCTKKTGNAHGVAYARAAIGLVGMSAGNATAARKWLDRARLDAGAVADHNRSAHVLHKLGLLMHRQEEPAMAAAYQREAMAIFSGLGNDLGVANTKLQLGQLTAERGAVRPAIALLEETLPTYRTLGDRRSEVDALLLLSDLNESERRAGPAWRYRQRAAQLSHTLRTGS